jgi:HSP20 family protein
MNDLATMERPQEIIELFPSFFNIGLERTSIAEEQSQFGNTLIVKADMPGISPNEHLRITFDDCRLQIRARRRNELQHRSGDTARAEIDYSAFSCDLLLPEGTVKEDVTSTYAAGVLLVRVCLPKPNGKPITIPIALRAQWNRAEQTQIQPTLWQ